MANSNELKFFIVYFNSKNSDGTFSDCISQVFETKEQAFDFKRYLDNFPDIGDCFVCSLIKL